MSVNLSRVGCVERSADAPSGKQCLRRRLQRPGPWNSTARWATASGSAESLVVSPRRASFSLEGEGGRRPDEGEVQGLAAGEKSSTACDLILPHPPLRGTFSLEGEGRCRKPSRGFRRSMRNTKAGASGWSIAPPGPMVSDRGDSA
jgi:hypothetical protein